jgi:hypothetical protein
MNSYCKDDAWAMRKIFMLSDHAYIRMIDHIFDREYTDADCVWKDWQDDRKIGFRVAGTNRYEIQVRRLDCGLRISGKDKGCIYDHGMDHKKRQERIVELENDSAWQMEEQGVVVFLPFLFEGMLRKLETADESTRQEALKTFVIHDIVGALGRSYQRGDLTSFDVQKLKQLCRQMAWKVLGREVWMQSMENQELILDALEADVDFLERASRIHSLDSERK